MSSPTSRWLIKDPRSTCSISIGSSIVTTCLWEVRLIRSIIAASVVLLPEPVVPVTRMMPRSSSARRLTTSGSWRSSTESTLKGTTLNTTLMDPRWRKMLTRNRPRSARVCDRSVSPEASNSVLLAS